jgi:peroxiredoxin
VSAGRGAPPARAGAGWIALALLAAAAFALLSRGGATAPLTRGSRAPDFELSRLDGQGSVSLAALRGRLVLLNFWATWCKPCEDEMPAMQRLYQALPRDGFELLAISVDEVPGEVVAFQQRLGVSFPILLDSDQRVARSFETFRFPETVLVGRDGVVIERFVGPKEWDAAAYVDLLRRLLAEPTP